MRSSEFSNFRMLARSVRHVLMVSLLLLCRCDTRVVTSPQSQCLQQAATPSVNSTERSQRLQRETSFVNSAISGGVAACAATVVFHPLDTVKTVLQQGGGAATMAHLSGKVGYRRAMIRTLGPRGLYRGVLPAAFSMMPACALRMAAYETLKGSLLHSAPPGLAPGALIFLASALSVVASSSIRAPLDLVKTVVQADASMSARRAMSVAWSGGVGGLYRGAGLGLMRDVPFFGCNLLIYEQAKAAALERKIARLREAGQLNTDSRSLSRSSRSHGGCGETSCGEVKLSALELLAIGAVAQGVAGFLTNPTDVLKTQVQSGAAANVGGAFRKCMRDGGPGRLIQGAGMRVATIAPQGCVYYPAYEAVQRILRRAPATSEERGKAGT